MDTSSTERVYKFDDSFIALYKVKFLQRKSPTSAFEIRRIKLMSFLTTGGFLYILCFVMKIVKHFNGQHLKEAEISEVCAIVSCFVVGFSRGTTLLIHRKQMHRLLQNLEKLFPVSKQDQLNYHLHGHAKTIIRRNKVMRLMASFGCVVYFTMPVFQSLFEYIFRGQPYVYRYPFICWHPFDDQQLYSFPIVYIIQMTVSMSALFFVVNEDFIFTISVTYMCMYYWHLGELLTQLDARFESRSCQKLNELIRYQYVLEDLRKDIDAIFSLSTFIGFTIMKTSICLFLFAIFHGIGIINMIPFITSSLVFLFPTYLRCSMGTSLNDASENLVDSLYGHNWYEGSPKHRKIISIMMARANKPASLHASSLIIVNMEYFKDFLIQTYEIFMFLHNFSS